jgi:hypothetical protein
LIHFGQSVDYKMLTSLPVNEIEPIKPLRPSSNQILKYVPEADIMRQFNQLREGLELPIMVDEDVSIVDSRDEFQEYIGEFLTHSM